MIYTAFPILSWAGLSWLVLASQDKQATARTGQNRTSVLYNQSLIMFIIFLIIINYIFLDFA